MKHFATGAVLVVLCTPVFAQTRPLTGGQEPGARAGTSYVPSTHTPGCAGLLCDGNDAKLAAPQKPCATVICGDVPVTASDVQRLQEDRVRAEAEAAAAASAKPAPRVRKARAKTRAPSAIAARTPSPVDAAK